MTAEGDEIYAGTSCAARKVGSTAAEVRRRLKVAKMNAEILEGAFADYYRRAFKMSIAECVAKYGPTAREGIDLVRKQWMRRNGHAA
ncbi:hypothetical protein [Streptomyces noursei]|uniref:hypothetical protein n=1 Tax=Streptomyces noursei TaxID=1971 RepID=UPI00382E4719